MSDWRPAVGDVVLLDGHDGLWRISHYGSAGVLLHRATTRWTSHVSVSPAALRPTVTTALERRLGKRQQSVLRCLREYGPWPGGGWTYSSFSATSRVMESLERLGLAVRDDPPPARAGGGLQWPATWRATTPAALPRPEPPGTATG